MRFAFTVPLERWDARRELWTHVVLPLEPAADIREVVGDLTGGFGSVRVAARVGGSDFRTSIFPTDGGSYVLPIKAAVRRAEGLELGDPVAVELELIDF